MRSASLQTANSIACRITLLSNSLRKLWWILSILLEYFLGNSSRLTIMLEYFVGNSAWLTILLEYFVDNSARLTILLEYYVYEIAIP